MRGMSHRLPAPYQKAVRSGAPCPKVEGIVAG